MRFYIDFEFMNAICMFAMLLLMFLAGWHSKCAQLEFRAIKQQRAAEERRTEKLAQHRLWAENQRQTRVTRPEEKEGAENVR